VSASNPASFPVGLAVGQSGGGSGYAGYAYGNTQPGGLQSFVYWYNVLPVYSGKLEVYNYDPVNTRAFVVSGYW
jgi:hypothetical protein